MKKVQNRKNMIKELLIQDNELNHSCLYNLLCSDVLDEVICKLDSSESGVEKGISREKHFLLLMDRLISTLSDNFHLGSKVYVILKMILEGCQKEILEDYLLSKKSFYDESNLEYYCDCIDKILIFNFYTNLKYLNQNTFFESLNIKISDFSEKKYRDEIKSVLMKIVNSNYVNKHKICFLFENINVRINNLKIPAEMVLNEYVENYQMLISNYLKFAKKINSHEILKIEKTSDDWDYIEINESTKLKVFYSNSKEICHITINDNQLMIEEVPFKEVIDLSIQCNCFAKSAKKTINGVYYKKYIDDYCDKYFKDYEKEK